MRKLKILFWQCEDSDRDACKFVYQEAKKQGYDVYMSGYRDPSQHHIFLEALERVQPDWVFSYAVKPFCNNVYNEIKQRGIKLAVSYHDQVCEFRKKMFHNMAGYFDVAIFSIKNAKDAYSFCAEKTVFLPQYFDDTFNELKWKRLDKSQEIYDLSFLSYVGCPLRKSYLNRLRKKYKILIADNLRGSDMTHAYAQSKIAIGLPRKGFTGSHGSYITSNRIYNAMGSGCFYLSHYIKDLDLFFKKGVHLDMVDNDSYKEFEKKIEFYLEAESVREGIAENGQKEILLNHTLAKRVPQYMSVLENF